MIDFFSEELKKDQNEIEALVSLAKVAIDIRADIEELESKVAAKKKDLARIENDFIIGKMDSLAISEFVLATGQKLKIKRSLQASIPKAKAAQAFKWLESNNFGGLIKTAVKVEFDRSAESVESASDLFTHLKESGLDADMDRKVHPQTLKAFVREQMEAGNHIPADLFNVHEVKIVEFE